MVDITGDGPFAVDWTLPANLLAIPAPPARSRIVAAICVLVTYETSSGVTTDLTALVDFGRIAFT